MIRIALVCLCLCCTNCDFARKVAWPTAVTCGAPVASNLFAHAWQIVQQDGFSAVFTGDSVDQLEDLALSYGADAVLCVLNELLSKVAPRGIEDPQLGLEDGRRASRIMHFLHERNVEVTP